MSGSEGGRAISVPKTVVLALAILAGVLAGCLVGYAAAPNKQDAARAAEVAKHSARATAYKGSFRESMRRGKRVARKRGKSVGRERGRSAGRRLLAKRARAAGRLQRARESACPAGQQLLRQMDTFYCGRPGPARPEDCPPGQVPVGGRGACAPRE